jgi:aminopeptidase N
MVGLEGFNDDATETKGISLFSIHILAATPSANTDGEVETIRSLVAHEYFHNWSGEAH